jgi:hypothetical protein
LHNVRQVNAKVFFVSAMSAKTIVWLRRSAGKLHKKTTNLSFRSWELHLAGGLERSDFNPTNKSAAGEYCFELLLDVPSSRQTDDDFD